MENINKLVEGRVNKLNNSNKDFKSIIEIMFSNGDYIFSEDNDGYKIYTHSFKEVYDRFTNLAYSLNIKYPNLKDKYIGISLETSLEFVIAFFAIIKSGNKPYLINHRHPKNLVNDLLKMLKIEYVIGDDLGYDAKLITLNELDLVALANYEFNYSNEMALSTSMTTLKKKVVFYNGEEIAYQILNVNGVLKNNKQVKKHYHERLKQLVFLPLYHIFGFMATFFWFSFFGRTMVFLNDYKSETILNTIKKHEVTHIFAVPLFWNTIEKQILAEVKKQGEKTIKKFNKGQKLCLSLQNTFKSKGLEMSKKIMKEVINSLFGRSVLFTITGGSYIKDSTLRLINSLGYPLYNGYGMSEIGITSVELGNTKDRLKNSIGKPFGSVEYKIENNVLYVRGKSISHKMMIENELIESNDWFNTNDLVHMDKDGRYYIDGRLDDLYISANGENVNPDVIEKEFNLDKDIRYSIINYDNKLVFVGEISELYSKDIITNIYNNIDEINKKLDLSMRVANIYFTYDQIQSETAIKVSRQYLLNKINKKEVNLYTIDELLEKKNNDNNEYNQKILDIVINLFSEALYKDKEEINPNSDFFFDLGGSSLEYFELISKINDEFNINIQFENDKLHSPLSFTKEIERMMSL